MGTGSTPKSFGITNSGVLWLFQGRGSPRAHGRVLETPMLGVKVGSPRSVAPVDQRPLTH